MLKRIIGSVGSALLFLVSLDWDPINIRCPQIVYSGHRGPTFMYLLSKHFILYYLHHPHQVRTANVGQAPVA